jgi:cephalosporin-C deacetylase-like acetyl esterase
MNLYDYTNVKPRFELKEIRKNRRWRQYDACFESAFEECDSPDRTVKGEYFTPESLKKAPLVILLHGVGDHSILPCRLLARTLIKKGFACFVLYLPVHTSRMPAEMKKRFPVLTPEEWFRSYRSAVIEVSQVIDWAGQRQELDADKIALVGISYGGFISAIAMGVDERIKAGVFIVAGGNSAKIHRKSALGSLMKKYKTTREDYQETQRSYFEYLAKVDLEGLENVEPARKSFLIDPMTYAHRLKERPVLMLNACWDETIPREATIDFWKEMGRPDINWYPTTHASIWLWYPFISRRINKFLKAGFENSGKTT